MPLRARVELPRLAVVVPEPVKTNEIELFKIIESDEYCKTLFSYPVKSYILRVFLAHKYRLLLFFVYMRNGLSNVIKLFR